MAALFGIVYLTDSVTSRFKQRNIELYETTEALSERTEELQRLLDEIAEVERRKSHYMRISAHQLRSPVGTIKASLQVLLDGYVEPVQRPRAQAAARRRGTGRRPAGSPSTTCSTWPRSVRGGAARRRGAAGSTSTSCSPTCSTRSGRPPRQPTSS